MTKKVGNTIVIENEPEDCCEFCGDFSELRPYGPKGERICYECGMKDEAAAERQFNRRYFDNQS